MAVGYETLMKSNKDVIEQATRLSEGHMTPAQIQVLAQFYACWAEMADSYLAANAQPAVQDPDREPYSAPTNVITS